METLRATRNRQFAKLWTSQGLSLVAQNLLNFALINRVYELSHGTRFANISVALLILSFGIPAIFFASAAGIYVDAWDRRKVMLTSNLLRALLVPLYFLIEHNLLFVLIVTFFMSTATQFFAPAESAAIPRLVSDEELLSANTLFIFTLYASFIVGYSASGPIIDLFGFHGPYFVATAMFAIATLMNYLLPAIPPAGGQLEALSKLYRSTIKTMAANWQAIRRNHNLYFPILQLAIVQSLLNIVVALSPALALALLKKPLPQVSQFIIIPAGLGMVVGVIAVGYVGKRFSKLAVVVTGMLAGSVALGLLGLSGQLYRHIGTHQIASITTISWTVAGLALILGCVNAIVSSSAQTLLQEHSPEADRAKIFGALLMLINIAGTAPVLLAGILADTFSPTEVVAALGAAVFAFAVGQAIWLETRGHTRMFLKKNA